MQKLSRNFSTFTPPNLFYTKKPMGYIKKQGTWMELGWIQAALNTV
jgi:hypothetical protein